MVRQQRALLDTAITITLVGVPIGTQALVGAGTNETRSHWPGRLKLSAAKPAIEAR